MKLHGFYFQISFLFRIARFFRLPDFLRCNDLCLFHFLQCRRREHNNIPLFIGFWQLAFCIGTKMAVDFVDERLFIVKVVIKHLSCFFQLLSEIHHPLELSARVSLGCGINALEKNKYLRCPFSFPTLKRPMKLFFGIGRIRFCIRRFLPPAPVHYQNKYIASVNFFINHTLIAAACGCQGVFPSQRLELDISPIAEPDIQLVNGTSKQIPLFDKVAGGGDKNRYFSFHSFI